MEQKQDNKGEQKSAKPRFDNKGEQRDHRSDSSGQKSDFSAKPKDLRQLVRIYNTDLNGEKPICSGLRNIKGINFQMANAVCVLANIDPLVKSGQLKENDIQKIEQIIKEPAKAGVPSWMFNRRRDYETNEDIHLTSSDLKFVQDNDIKRMKKIKSYKGVRHIAGLPVRGQRTKSNFRKTKGKVLGVIKKSGIKPTDKSSEKGA